MSLIIDWLVGVAHRKIVMFIVRIVLTVVNVVVALLLLLSTMAGIVSPSKVALLSLLSYAFVPLLLVNVLFVVLWAVMRRWQVLVSLAVIVLRYNSLLLCFQIGGTSEATVDEGRMSLKVMTFNVHGFAGEDGETAKTTGVGDFMALMRAEQPDVIAIQEFEPPTKYKLVDSLKAMGYKYRGGCASRERLFSRYPIKKRHEYKDGCMYYADVKKDGVVVRVVGVHLASYQLGDSDLEAMSNVAHGKSDRKALGVVGKLRKAVVVHENQWSGSLQPMIAAYEGPLVMMGDFNDTPTSYLHTQISQYLTDAFIEQGTGLGITYHGKFPMYRIDYVFHSAHLKALAYKCFNTEISDHNPVIVTFEIER